MIPYLATFLCSTLSVFLAGRSKGILRIALLAAGLLLPCALAGLRDETVGTDVRTYLIWEFSKASTCSLLPYLQGASSTAPVGYNLLVWVATSITHSLNGVMFLIQIPSIGCLLYSLWKRDRQTAWAGFLVYLFVLFPISLNAIKQMLAVSIVSLSLGSAVEGRPIKYSVVVIVASLFHQTAIASLLIYPFVRLLLSIGKKSAFFGRAQSYTLVALVFAAFSFLFVAGHSLIEFFSVFKESYSYQANAKESRLNYSAAVLLVVSTGTTLAVWRDRTSLCRSSAGKKELMDYLVVSSITIVGLAAMQLNMVATSLIRLGYYGLIFLPLMVQEAMVIGGGRGRGLAVIQMLFCVAYFYVAYVVNGGNAVYPYMSTMLGIG